MTCVNKYYTCNDQPIISQQFIPYSVGICGQFELGTPVAITGFNEDAALDAGKQIKYDGMEKRSGSHVRIATGIVIPKTEFQYALLVQRFRRDKRRK